MSLIASVGTIFSLGWIYLVLYAVLAGAMIAELFVENQRFSIWLARGGATLIILFIGLRWETGTDWIAYFRVFYTNDTSADYDVAVFGVDQGFLLLNQLGRWLSEDYAVFLFITSAVSVGLVYFFIEQSTRYPCTGVYLFYTTYAVTHFMGSNRRMIAIGLACAGFAFLRLEQPVRKQWHKWAVPFALAATVHRTSIAALPGFFVSRRAWPAPAVIVGLIACIGLGISGLPFQGLQGLATLLSEYTGFAAINKLAFYTSGEAQLDANLNVPMQAALGVARRSTTLVIAIIFMHLYKPSSYAQRLYNFYILGCGIYFLMVGAPIFQIISTYFSMVEIVLIPIILSQLPHLKVPFILYLLAVPLLLLLSALIPYLYLYVPYHSIFDYR